MTDQTAIQLRSTVEKTLLRLREVDETAARRKPAPEKWSIQEILGHLIDSAVNNHHRFIRAQEAGDVLVFPKYEQDYWVTRQGYNEACWPELIDLWRLYNHHLCHVIQSVDPDALAVECRIGPGEPVTLQFLIEDYLYHLEHHLSQIHALMEGLDSDA